MQKCPSPVSLNSEAWTAKDTSATKYDTITFDEVYKLGLNVMDLTAFTLCKENNLPIVVFDMDTVGNLEKVLADKNIGTLVSN